MKVAVIWREKCVRVQTVRCMAVGTVDVVIVCVCVCVCVSEREREGGGHRLRWLEKMVLNEICGRHRKEETGGRSR